MSNDYVNYAANIPFTLGQTVYVAYPVREEEGDGYGDVIDYKVIEATVHKMVIDLVAPETAGSDAVSYWQVRLHSTEEPLVEEWSYCSNDLGSKIFSDRELADARVAELSARLRQKEEEKRKALLSYAAEFIQNEKTLLSAAKCCITDDCNSCPLIGRHSECRSILIAALEQVENQ